MPMFDFKDGRGPVPAHQHSNGGGWVADTAYVSDTAYIGPNARVFGHAQVRDQAQVYGQARVYGQAWVSSQSHVYTVTPEEATLLGLKGQVKLEQHIDKNLIQVYDASSVNNQVNINANV